MEKEKVKLPEDVLIKKNYVFDTLLEHSEEKDWYWNELQNGGPDHKKVLTSLLMSSLDKLVKKVESKKHLKFEPQSGASVEKDYTTGKHTFPIEIPASVGTNHSVSELISSAPDHELLAYSSALQAIEWLTKSI